MTTVLADDSLKMIVIIKTRMNTRSKYREVIIRILRNTKSHPTAEWIYRRVKREIPEVGIATIYRNLKSLSSDGQINAIASTNGINHFDANVDEHYHVRCVACGRIADIDESVNRDIESRVAEKSGFQIYSHSLELIGLCSSCRKQGKERYQFDLRQKGTQSSK